MHFKHIPNIALKEFLIHIMYHELMNCSNIPISTQLSFIDQFRAELRCLSNVTSNSDFRTFINKFKLQTANCKVFNNKIHQTIIRVFKIHLFDYIHELLIKFK